MTEPVRRQAEMLDRITAVLPESYIRQMEAVQQITGSSILPQQLMQLSEGAVLPDSTLRMIEDLQRIPGLRSRPGPSLSFEDELHRGRSFADQLEMEPDADGADVLAPAAEEWEDVPDEERESLPPATRIATEILLSPPSDQSRDAPPPLTPLGDEELSATRTCLGKLTLSTELEISKDGVVSLGALLSLIFVLERTFAPLLPNLSVGVLGGIIATLILRSQTPQKD